MWTYNSLKNVNILTTAIILSYKQALMIIILIDNFSLISYLIGLIEIHNTKGSSSLQGIFPRCKLPWTLK